MSVALVRVEHERILEATHISVTFSKTMAVLVRVVPSTLSHPTSLTDVVIESNQLPGEFFPSVHNDPNLRTYTFVDEFYRG